MKKFFVSFFLIFICNGGTTLFAASDQKEENINLFVEVVSYIKSFYYQEVPLNDCIQKILKNGVSACTDPYSYYLNEEELKEERSEFFQGEFGGIGARLEIKKGSNGVTIVRVEEDSPAEKAGLLAGDLIIAVSTETVKSNWVWVEGLDLRTVVKMIRGLVGTKVMLKIIRDKEEKEFTIARAVIQIKPVESKKIGQGRIGYLKITEFSGYRLVDKVAQSLKDFQNENLPVVIIDLRNNPGGLLNLVLDIASFFAKEENSPMIFTKTRDGPYVDSSNIKAGQFRNFKLIVLQNENSASASEILSGYLQAECGAVVIGKKSFGKGIVQRLFQLNSGGELHLTVSEYFIGKNRIKVHGIGIQPAIEIDNPKEVKTEADDLQLKRALKEANNL